MSFNEGDKVMIAKDIYCACTRCTVKRRNSNDKKCIFNKGNFI